MRRRMAARSTFKFDVEAVLKADEGLRAQDEMWRGLGYKRGPGRGRRRSDGTISLSFSWQKRSGNFSTTATYAMAGLVWK